MTLGSLMARCSTPSSRTAHRRDGLGDSGLAASEVLVQPGEVVVDAAGDMLICDTADKRIREVSGPATRLG